MNYLRHIYQGMIMGIAELIPGVSGSTLALILGIYERFLNILFAVSQIVTSIIRFILGQATFVDIKKAFSSLEWGFAIPLILGMGISIVSLAGLLHYGLENHPQYIFAGFTGLVLATLSVPWDTISHKKPIHYGIVSVSALVFIGIFSLQPVVALTNPSLPYLFFGAILGISAMVLPGVSGSFILLLLGLYSYVLSLVERIITLDTAVVLPLIVFCVGLVTGFVLFIGLLKQVFENHNDLLMAFLTGLLIASFRVTWPFFLGSPESSGGVQYISPFDMSLTMVGGIIISFCIGLAVIGIMKVYSDKI